MKSFIISDEIVADLILNLEYYIPEREAYQVPLRVKASCNKGDWDYNSIAEIILEQTQMLWN